MRSWIPRTSIAALMLAAGAGVAHGTEHLMVVQEVFPGTPANPAAQYVMLRMTARGQTLLNGTFIDVTDASGTLLGRFGTFDHNVANAGAIGCVWPNCPAVVMGTAAAQAAFGFTFDQVVDAQAGRASLPLSGGRVCFRITTAGNPAMDCVAWGSFTGANTIPTPTFNGCDANFGLPAAALSPGFALTRKLFSCASKENSTDFENRFPHPVADDGSNANVDTDADGLIDALDCDDVVPGAGLYFPLGVASLDVTGGLTASFSWSPEPAPAGSSLRYDVTQMSLADLTSQPGCDAAGRTGFFVSGAGVTGTTLVDATDPGPGKILYYAVRSRSICGPAPFC